LRLMWFQRPFRNKAAAAGLRSETEMLDKLRGYLSRTHVDLESGVDTVAALLDLPLLARHDSPWAATSPDALVMLPSTALHGVPAGAYEVAAADERGHLLREEGLGHMPGLDAADLGEALCDAMLALEEMEEAKVQAQEEHDEQEGDTSDGSDDDSADAVVALARRLAGVVGVEEEEEEPAEDEVTSQVPRRGQQFVPAKVVAMAIWPARSATSSGTSASWRASRRSPAAGPPVDGARPGAAAAGKPRRGAALGGQLGVR